MLTLDFLPRLSDTREAADNPAIDLPKRAAIPVILKVPVVGALTACSLTPTQKKWAVVLVLGAIATR